MNQFFICINSISPNVIIGPFFALTWKNYDLLGIFLILLDIGLTWGWVNELILLKKWIYSSSIGIWNQLSIQWIVTSLSLTLQLLFSVSGRLFSSFHPLATSKSRSDERRKISLNRQLMKSRRGRSILETDEPSQRKQIVPQKNLRTAMRQWGLPYTQWAC